MYNIYIPRSSYVHPTPYMHPAYTQPASYITSCMPPIYAMHASYIHHACLLHTPCMPPTYAIHASVMRHARLRHSSCIPPTSCIYHTYATHALYTPHFKTSYTYIHKIHNLSFPLCRVKKAFKMLEKISFFYGKEKFAHNSNNNIKKIELDFKYISFH